MRKLVIFSTCAMIVGCSSSKESTYSPTDASTDTQSDAIADTINETIDSEVKETSNDVQSDIMIETSSTDIGIESSVDSNNQDVNNESIDSGCVTGTFKCVGNPARQLEQCDIYGTSWIAVALCETSALCTDTITADASTTMCIAPVCTVGQKQCTGNILQICNNGRDGWDNLQPCQSYDLCQISLTADSGDCSPVCPTGCSSCGALEECIATPGSSCKICASKSVAITGGYSIDSTETTYTQYHNWILTGPSYPPTTPNNVCSWKTNDYNEGTGSGNLPVANVDWCDAYAYCAGVGKRLCGKIGGGPSNPSESCSASIDQWFNACTSNGQYNYPYGPNGISGTCNDNGYWTNKDAGNLATTLPVGTLPGCTSTTSGYTNVYDLSGDVEEWEDSCFGTDLYSPCDVRGGSFLDAAIVTACNTSDHNARNVENNHVGFRCCTN